jgi:hypothetical protein
MKLRIVFNSIRIKEKNFVLFYHMGPNHPISLRLKKNYGWEGTLYKWQNQTMHDLASLQKNLLEVIYHYFQYVLISKPKFYYTTGGLKIKIAYYLAPLNQTHSLKKKEPSTVGRQHGGISHQDQQRGFQKTYGGSSSLRLDTHPKHLRCLVDLMEKRTGKRVKLQLIRLGSPILDSKILASFISICLRRYSISAIWRITLAKIKNTNAPLPHRLINVDSRLDREPSQGFGSFHHFDWNHLLTSGFFSKEFNSYINGLKLKISGRPSKRRGASRTKVKNYGIGSFKFNSILGETPSLIDYGHIERKDKNGSQSIKVYTSTMVIIP